MKSCGLVMLGVLVMVAGLAGQVRGDLVAPSWRGAAGTTYSEWDFTTAATTAVVPDSYTNGYGTPQAAISQGYGASGWYTSYPPISGGSAGVWDMGRGTEAGYPDGSITLALPVGLTSGGGTTNVWIQVVYYSDLTGAPTVDVTGATEVASSDTLVANVGSPWGSWRDCLTEWQFSSAQTDVQAVVLGNYNDTMLDSLVVDTQVVPEPASLTLLGLGALGLMVRRRSAQPRA